MPFSGRFFWVLHIQTHTHTKVILSHFSPAFKNCYILSASLRTLQSLRSSNKPWQHTGLYAAYPRRLVVVFKTWGPRAKDRLNSCVVPVRGGGTRTWRNTPIVIAKSDNSTLNVKQIVFKCEWIVKRDYKWKGKHLEKDEKWPQGKLFWIWIRDDTYIEILWMIFRILVFGVKLLCSIFIVSPLFHPLWQIVSWAFFALLSLTSLTSKKV